MAPVVKPLKSLGFEGFLLLGFLFEISSNMTKWVQNGCILESYTSESIEKKGRRDNRTELKYMLYFSVTSVISVTNLKLSIYIKAFEKF